MNTRQDKRTARRTVLSRILGPVRVRRKRSEIWIQGIQLDSTESGSMRDLFIRSNINVTSQAMIDFSRASVYL